MEGIAPVPAGSGGDEGLCLDAEWVPGQQLVVYSTFSFFLKKLCVIPPEQVGGAGGGGGSNIPDVIYLTFSLSASVCLKRGCVCVCVCGGGGNYPRCPQCAVNTRASNHRYLEGVLETTWFVTECSCGVQPSIGHLPPRHSEGGESTCDGKTKYLVITTDAHTDTESLSS